MVVEIDHILVGTGLAPLVAAQILIQSGKKVAIVNPSSDFFLENSELPFDPFWPLMADTNSMERLQRSTVDTALATLRPFFPGALELWDPLTDEGKQRDPDAPFVRRRKRIWNPLSRPPHRSIVEEFFLLADEFDLKPELVSGYRLKHLFPGFSAKVEPTTGDSVLIPDQCDVDVIRYRSGILEYLGELLGPDQLICPAPLLEFEKDGVRLKNQYLKASGCTYVFWTPAMNSIVRPLLSATQWEELRLGIRTWEEWSFLSREPLQIETLGTLGDLTIWADALGSPNPDFDSSRRFSEKFTRRLNLLRPAGTQDSNFEVASAASLMRLSDFFSQTLGWDSVTVRSLRTRRTFEFKERKTLKPNKDSNLRIFTGSDGALVEVVSQVKKEIEAIL